MNQPVTPTPSAATPPQAQPAPEANPAVQGEGDYDAARRHRASVKEFIDAGKVGPAADKAAPADVAEDRELRDAEAEGRAKARR